MKRLHLLKLAIAAVLVTHTFSSEAQLISLVEPSFLVNSPASVSGIKLFTKSNSGIVTDPGNWGRAIDSFWFNIPVAIPGNDTLGCSAAQPGSLAGKFALISRGNCMFSEKAYNAQLAGAVAVVIYNNVSGGPVGMAAGTNASLVTIPVIMISQSDGLAMKAQIDGGQQVNASLTNWGFGFTHDLAIVNNSMPLFHNLAIPKYELNGDTNFAYRSYLGALVANVGAATESNLKLKSSVKFVPNSGSAITLIQDSVIASSIQPIDSVIEMLSPRAQVLPAVPQKGRLDWTYTLTATAADNQTGNNTSTFSVDVTDSIYSKARINANGEPVASISYRYTGNFVNTWGPMFYINNGGHFANKAQFTVSNGDNTISLDGKSVSLYLFKWTDANSDRLIDAGELALTGAGVKNFTTLDSNFDMFTVQLVSQPVPSQPLTLDAKSFYWLAAEVTNDLFLGCDGSSNYYMRSYTAKNSNQNIIDYWAPQFQGSTNDLQNSSDFLTHFPFQDPDSTNIENVNFVRSKGLVPAISLHSSISPTSSIPGVTKTVSLISVYPNPAKNVLNVSLKADNSTKEVSVSVIDAIGRVVYRSFKPLNNGQFTIDLNGYNAGNYFLIVRNGETITSNTFTVIK